jgi:hypothetical protein
MLCKHINADVAKLADALDLGSSSERSEGSSPFIRTFKNILGSSPLDGDVIPLTYIFHLV